MSAGDLASGEASSSSSPSSRILVLSPSPQQVPLSSLEHLVRSITSSSEEEDDPNDFDADGDADGADSKQVAWTISNRYYTADVHFRLVALDLDVGATGKAARTRRPPRRVAANGGGDAGEEQASSSAAQDPSTRLRAELTGVPAIILVMPGGQHVAAHDRVLASLQEAAAAGQKPQEKATDENDDDTAMPMGFELGASVVVCLPRVLQQATGIDADPDPGIAESDEQLRDLYAEHGWEFVDLARDLGIADEEGESDDGNEQRLGEGDGDDEEEDGQGFKRVREALEAHIWPGLRRKATTRGLASGAAEPVAQQGQPSAAGGIDEALRRVDHDSGQQRGLLSGSRDPIMGTGVGATSSHLPANNTNGNGSSNGPPSAPLNLVDVQPTAEDEELARKFLAQINQFERESGGLAGDDDGVGSSTAPETEEARQAKQEEALRRLEEFLENEDATWGRTREVGLQDDDEDDENPLAGAAASGLHFEDDFDDFVNAAPPGRHDDANDSGAAAASAFAGIDLEGSLQQLRHEAQRVRGMPGDQEAKEREAEDIVKKMLERWQLDD